LDFYTSFVKFYSADLTSIEDISKFEASLKHNLLRVTRGVGKKFPQMLEKVAKIGPKSKSAKKCPKVPKSAKKCQKVPKSAKK
jgi:hypothetical protein